MNTKEYVEAHAAAAKRSTDSWHRQTAPHFEAQMRARDTEAAAKAEALQRSANYHRDLGGAR